WLSPTGTPWFVVMRVSGVEAVWWVSPPRPTVALAARGGAPADLPIFIVLTWLLCGTRTRRRRDGDGQAKRFAGDGPTRGLQTRRAGVPKRKRAGCGAQSPPLVVNLMI